MLQAASIYTQGDGKAWEKQKMLNIMLEVAKTSLRVLDSDLSVQLTKQVKRD